MRYGLLVKWKLNYWFSSRYTLKTAIEVGLFPETQLGGFSRRTCVQGWTKQLFVLLPILSMRHMIANVQMPLLRLRFVEILVPHPHSTQNYWEWKANIKLENSIDLYLGIVTKSCRDRYIVMPYLLKYLCNQTPVFSALKWSNLCWNHSSFTSLWFKLIFGGSRTWSLLKRLLRKSNGLLEVDVITDEYIIITTTRNNNLKLIQIAMMVKFQCKSRLQFSYLFQ